MANDNNSNHYYTDGGNTYNNGGYTREGGYTYGYNHGSNSYTYGTGNYTHGGGGSYTYGPGGQNSYLNGSGSYVNGAGSYVNEPYNQPTARPSDGKEASINYMEWLMRFVSKWYLFVIGVVVAICVGFIINRKWTAQYTTESKIMVEQDKSDLNANMLNSLMGGGYSNNNADVNNQLIVLGSYPLINRTVQKLPLMVDCFVKGRFKTASLYGHEPAKITEISVSPEAYAFVFRFIPVDDKTFKIDIDKVYDNKLSNLAEEFKPITGRYGEKVTCSLFTIDVQKKNLLPRQSDFFFKFRSMRSLEDEFASRLQLSYMGKTKEPTTVVSLSLTSDNPERDADFLNALGKEYLAENLEEKNEEVERTIDFINEQLYLLSDSLNTSESRLRQYRSVNNIVDMSSYSGQAATKLEEMDKKRSEFALQDAYFTSLSKYLTQNVMDEKILAPSSIGVADPTLLELVAQFNELQQKRSDIGVKNPQYERYSKRMNEIRETLLEVLKNVRHIHNLERKAFEREYASVNSTIKTLPEKEFNIVNYERKYKVNDNYYTFLLQKQSQAQITLASNVPDNKVLQDARTTLDPVNSKDKMMVYLICLVVGLLVPAAYLILIYLLDNKINTEEDILKVSPFPVISSLLHTDSKEVVVSTKSKRSVFTERYRLLRSRIELFTQRKSNIMVLLTSSESGDGKSSVSLNLAGIYSMISKKVVLVDMDLRNPSNTRKFNYKNNKGLVNVVINDAELDDVIIKNDDRLGFDFIPSGLVPPNSAELIRSDKMAETMAALRERYDYVIIDTSPLGLVSDAMEMMKVADVNIVVCRALKTNKKFFRNFIQQLNLDMVNNVCVVLNDIPVVKHTNIFGFGKFAGGKYYTGGKHGYGYGYYYGSSYYNREADKYYHSEEKSDDGTSDSTAKA